jgi:hypothetical protein
MVRKPAAKPASRKRHLQEVARGVCVMEQDYEYAFCTDTCKVECGGFAAETLRDALDEFGATEPGRDGALFCGERLVAVRKNGACRIIN